MLSLRQTALLVAALACLSAQTPAASPPASDAPIKPLRHLEYTFSADYQGVAGGHGAQGPGINPVGGTVTGIVSAGRKGTLDVEVFGVAPDGSLIIGISEWIQNSPRARQQFKCLVYGNTSVICPLTLQPTDAEYALLGFLGRQFVDAAPWDANSHWQLKDSKPEYETVADFSLSDPGGDKPVIVTVHRKVVVHDVGFETITDNAKVTYDRAMEVPVAVYDDRVTSYGNGSNQATFNFTLAEDSFAKKPL